MIEWNDTMLRATTAKRLSPLMTTPKQQSKSNGMNLLHPPAMRERIHTNKSKVNKGSKSKSSKSKIAKNVKWTPDDDEKLRKAVKKHSEKNWKAIANDAFGTAKSDVQCLHRWRKVLDPTIKKGPWTPDEDSLILEGIKEHGEGKWSEIAKNISGRLGKQCRERWMNHLDPKIKKGPFTEEEDLKIIELHAKYGTQWTKIRRDMHGRTDNAIKNRFYSHLKRRCTNSANVQAPKKAPPKPKSNKKKTSKKRRSNIQLDIEEAARALAMVGSPPVKNTKSTPTAKIRKTERREVPRFSLGPDDPARTPGPQPSPEGRPGPTPDIFIASPLPATPPTQNRRESYSPALKHKRQSAELFFNPHADSPPSGCQRSPSDSLSRWPQFTPGISSRFKSPRLLSPVPPHSNPNLSIGSGFTSPPPRTPLEMTMYTSPRGPRTPGCRRILPSDLSSPCPPMTPLREGKNLIDEMMDEAENDKTAVNERFTRSSMKIVGAFSIEDCPHLEAARSDGRRRS